MLKSLSVKNYAIVRDVTFDLDPGLSILSGETGTGKSILIGALDLILGERASTDIVRSGEDLAVVEATIDELPDSAVKMIDELDIEREDDPIIVRREVQAKGASRAFINGRMVQLSALKKIASTMFDLVGQHQQQYLIDTSNHIKFLDNFGGLERDCEIVEVAFDEYEDARLSLIALRERAAKQDEDLELHRFQIKEIEQAKLCVEEEAELVQEKKILENADRLKTALGGIAGVMTTGDHSISSRISNVEDMLTEAGKIDETLTDDLHRVESARIELEDIGQELASRAEDIEADPERLQVVEDRLEVYYNLKKKYGGSVEGVVEYYNRIKKDIEQSENLDGDIDKLEERLAVLCMELSKAAIKLSDERIKQADALSRRVEKELTDLGMGKADFEVRLVCRKSDSGIIEHEGERYAVERNGIDEVEFFFCANKGEDVRPLAKIASGGELSRVMLALKSVGARKKKLETLIFDEIDTGIGGETATAVGKKLRKLGQRHQIIVITHLQQIAAAGQHHHRVFKAKQGGRMVTRIKTLTEDERREEIGRMLSGDKLTDTSLKQAEELLSEYE